LQAEQPAANRWGEHFRAQNEDPRPKTELVGNGVQQATHDHQSLQTSAPTATVTIINIVFLANFATAAVAERSRGRYKECCGYRHESQASEKEDSAASRVNENDR
jgi:hypothetical protein